MTKNFLNAVIFLTFLKQVNEDTAFFKWASMEISLDESLEESHRAQQSNRNCGHTGRAEVAVTSEDSPAKGQ